MGEAAVGRVDMVSSSRRLIVPDSFGRHALSDALVPPTKNNIIKKCHSEQHIGIISCIIYAIITYASILYVDS
jgi:hypothetical protein